jgi:hypothetical protein
MIQPPPGKYLYKLPMHASVFTLIHIKDNYNSEFSEIDDVSNLSWNI